MSRRVDDPSTINAFLRLIHATPLSASPNAQPEVMAQTVPSALLDPSYESGVDIGLPETSTAANGTSTSVEVSPTQGSRAPPPTPETQPISNGTNIPLEPIFEDDTDWQSGVKQASRDTENSGRTERDSSAENQGSQATTTPDSMSHDLTPTQHALLVKKRTDIAEEDKAQIIRTLRERATCYMDETVEKFRKAKAAMFAEAERQAFQEASHVATANENRNQDTRMVGPGQPPTLAESPKTPVSVAGLHLSDDDSPIHRMQDPTIKDEGVPIVQEIETVKERIQTADESSFGALASGSTLSKDTNSSNTPATANADTKDGNESSDESSDEDREYLMHFKSWGNPAARHQPSSRVRKVILTGLPLNADLTLVQSLIHGGAVEHMALAPASIETRTVTAHIIFVSADACDKFYDKYPNGIDLRHQSKQHAIMVEKGKNVDVISGMMQGYLECGATRVVKVSLVDDDWGIVALHKLAEGKQKVRQVEAVVDMYRNDNRTVIFRFGSITHAVQFKGVLIRSHDFEGCPVGFAEDPCEVATGFHYY